MGEPFFGFTDINKGSENYDMIKRMAAHFPGGTGWKNLIHLTQQIISDGEVMRKFDHGEKRNFEIYGTKTAPL